MKTNKSAAQTEALRKMEDQINAHLQALTADQRPELPTRRRVQSVAYSAAGYFQATDSDGHIDDVSISDAMAWLRIESPAQREEKWRAIASR